jgi:hypothetical protein
MPASVTHLPHIVRGRGRQLNDDDVLTERELAKPKIRTLRHLLDGHTESAGGEHDHRDVCPVCGGRKP